MPSFKPKPKKNISRCVNNQKTIDTIHKELMKEFYDLNNIKIPKLKKKRKNIKKKINNDKLSIFDKIELNDKLKNINNEIKSLKNKKKIYLLNNSKYIFDYFENKIQKEKNKNKKYVLHSFFKKNKNTINNNNYNKYLLNNKFFKPKILEENYEICNKCNGELIKVEHEGVLICNLCGNQKKFLIRNEIPSYKDPPKEVCFYAYKRINHFREILAQFQAKETTTIPKNVIEDIKNQIKKERIDLKELDNKKAKEILKKLGYNKYYEHIPFIKDKLGIKPPIMSQELENKLCNLFMDIQKPYANNCPNYRVNFLNYYYVLYKICELLQEERFLHYFPMLKDPLKRMEQDQIWKKICNDLKWEFIPTI